MVEIKGFIPNSLIEWEGRIASIVFLAGCNLRCRYCHAHHLILNPRNVERTDSEQVFRYVRRQGRWLDGVVITGGEPTLHGEGLVDLVSRFRELDVPVMVETNGTRPEWIGRLLRDGLLEGVAMDLKAPLTCTDYRRVAGVEVRIEDIRNSIIAVRTSGLWHEFRLTVVPGLVGPDELERMAPELEGARQVAIQNFRPELCLDPALREVAPFKAEELDELARIVQPFVGRVIIRGRDNAALCAARRA
jgi:pyruvate formate lyase activating enzyme